MFTIQNYLKETAACVDAELNRRVPPETTEPRRLHAAMRHSLFGSGKRLRPVLCVAAAEAVGGKAAPAITAGAAIEVLHTYTLIHDDLPAMDNDVLRRGRPTCHVAFDEATAILAGDALLTLAFAILIETPCLPPGSPIELVRELAAASGSTGVIGGQMADIEGEDQTLTLEQLRYIHTHKTGDLIRASARIGAMTAGASPAELAALTLYAEKIGLAFQIADDVLNATGTPEQLGKSAGTDQAAGKLTYVAAYGIEGARHQAETLVREARQALAPLSGDTEPLRALADYIISRTS